jgi:hypothetical protein
MHPPSMSESSNPQFAIAVERSVQYWSELD